MPPVTKRFPKLDDSGYLEASNGRYHAPQISIIPLADGRYALTQNKASARLLIAIGYDLEDMLAPIFEEFHENLGKARAEAEHQRELAKIRAADSKIDIDFSDIKI